MCTVGIEVWGQFLSFFMSLTWFILPEPRFSNSNQTDEQEGTRWLFGFDCSKYLLINEFLKAQNVSVSSVSYGLLWLKEGDSGHWVSQGYLVQMLYINEHWTASQGPGCYSWLCPCNFMDFAFFTIKEVVASLYLSLIYWLVSHFIEWQIGVEKKLWKSCSCPLPPQI